MKAVVLARVSTEEQKETGNSLPAQQARLRNYIDRTNLELIREFIFDESASKEVRKEYYQGITKDDYDKKLQELKDQQYQLEIEQGEYTKADHEYHIHVGTVLNLSRRIGDIFESSEVAEKRAILNFLLQNPVVEDKKLVFTLRKPFNTVLELASSPNWLRTVDAFRTANWTRIKSDLQFSGILGLFPAPTLQN